MAAPAKIHKKIQSKSTIIGLDMFTEFPLWISTVFLLNRLPYLVCICIIASVYAILRLGKWGKEDGYYKIALLWFYNKYICGGYFKVVLRDSKGCRYPYNLN